MRDATVQLQVIFWLRSVLRVNEYFFGFVTGSGREGVIDFCKMNVCAMSNVRG